MDCQAKLKEEILCVERGLEQYFAQRENPQHTIYEAMGYSLFAGGKRIRPVMMRAFCEMCGGDPEKVMPFACALEMIHTYSLIHDDLPCMDDDDLRRGKPTNHRVFGEAMAVLAGDGLLNKAFETVCDHAPATGLGPAVILRALGVIAHESGSEGMVGGQVVDLQSEGQQIPLELLQYLENLKTGALFRAACKVGAIVGGGSEQQIAAAEQYATKIGLAFQIQDDILDVEGDEALLGKPIGSDAEEDKCTFVSLLSLEKAKEAVRTLTDEAVQQLSVFPQHEYAKFLAEMMVGRQK